MVYPPLGTILPILRASPMQKNRYLRRAKISEAKFRQFLRLFALDMEATKIAVLTGLNRNTVNRLAKMVRQRLAEAADREHVLNARAEAVDATDTPVTRSTKRFGNQDVQACLIPGGAIHVRLASSQVEEAVGTVAERSSSNALVAAAEDQPRVGNPPAGQTGTTSAKLLDYFWSHTQLRLAKFKGTSSRTFELHLKESEFRFNHRRDELYPVLLRMFRDQSISPVNARELTNGV